MSEKTNWQTTNLFISLYDEKNKQRADELYTCLMNNLKSGCFDAVWVIAECDENGKVDYLRDVNPYTVNVLPCTTRPTFRTFFNAINNIDDMLKRDFNSSIGKMDDAINVGMPITVQPKPEESVYILANSDIYFEDLPILPNSNQCFALTRYDVLRDGSVKFVNRKDCTDTWAFRGKIRDLKYDSFWLGIPGCDNRVNFELLQAGYEISNPSLTIKTYHLHYGDKSYDGSRKINTPYHFLNPHE